MIVLGIDIGTWPIEARLAYIAGLIDGEGCISVRRRMPTARNKHATPTYTLGVGVEMTDRGPVEMLATHCGCPEIVRVREREGFKDIYVFQLSGRRAAELLLEVRRYLIGKGDQADTALAFWAHRAQSRKHRTKVVGEHVFAAGPRAGGRYVVKALSDEFIAACDGFYRALRKREQRSRWDGRQQ